VFAAIILLLLTEVEKRVSNFFGAIPFLRHVSKTSLFNQLYSKDGAQNSSSIHQYTGPTDAMDSLDVRSKGGSISETLEYKSWKFLVLRSAYIFIKISICLLIAFPNENRALFTGAIMRAIDTHYAY
jgi:hypothetical protein